MKMHDWRLKRGITATEFGARVGVSHSTVLRWESGETTPSPKKIRLILAATNGQVRLVDIFPPEPKKETT